MKPSLLIAVTDYCPHVHVQATDKTFTPTISRSPALLQWDIYHSNVSNIWEEEGKFQIEPGTGFKMQLK